ncbi:hypothetical protein PAPYR_9439 [Paratrimastix pyriformis]|uniref:Uncharacterized protein n=1 Tax=Paratrimastix pyriformis TaxID=342808 RepID=A0ABQ8U8D5_9EUKA|nr:hypothetical protein PAPYR_9439 [Paratrimastix pyriformis]
MRAPKKSRKSQLPSILLRFPQDLFRLIILKLFDFPMRNFTPDEDFPGLVPAKRCLYSLLQVCRPLNLAISAILSLDHINYSAIIPARITNDYSDSSGRPSSMRPANQAQRGDAARLRCLDVLRADYVSWHIAVHKHLVALAPSMESFLKRTLCAGLKAAMVDCELQACAAYQAQLDQESLSLPEVQRLNAEIASANQKASELDVMSLSALHEPNFSRFFFEVTNSAECVLFSKTGDLIHAVKRVDIPWGMVVSRLADFVERHRCPVVPELTPELHRVGRGTLPVYIEFKHNLTSDPHCILGVSYGVPLPAARSGPVLKPSSLASRWLSHLGFLALDRHWSSPVPEGRKVPGWAYGEARGSRALVASDGAIPEQETDYQDSPDDPLFVIHSLSSLFPTQANRKAPSYSPRDFMNPRLLRRLMAILGLGELGDIDIFCDFLFTLCGQSLPEAKRFWDEVITVMATNKRRGAN